MLSDLRLYFVSVLQNISVALNEIIYISVSISIFVNEYNTADYFLKFTSCLDTIIALALGQVIAGVNWNIAAS